MNTPILNPARSLTWRPLSTVFATWRIVPLLLGTTVVASARQSPIDPSMDASTGVSVLMMNVDLTVPVLEPIPAGGFPWVEQPVIGRRPALQGTPGQGTLSPSPPAASERSFAIRNTIEAALVNQRANGDVWVRTKDFRVSFTDEGVTAYPIFGPSSPQEWPVQIDLSRVRSGADEVNVARSHSPVVEGESVVLQRAGVREVIHLGADQIEQTFVFDALPSEGDLVLDLAVSTELEAQVEGDSLRFVHPDFGGVSYGEAVVVDAAGRRLEISRRWTGEGIQLTVPASFLAGATLPVTVDPIISAFSNGFGNPNDDAFPDACYVGVVGRYFMCWQESTSATNADVYCTSYDPSGSQGTSWAVEITNDYWATPRIAAIAPFGRLLIVASKTTNGPGTSSGAIVGQLANTGSSQNVGPDFFVSTQGSFKVEPDVAGTNYDSVNNNNFLVVWSRLLPSGNQSIESRVIDWVGNAVGSVTVLENIPGIRSRQPALSKTYGDHSLNGDIWTAVWIRDEQNDGEGAVWARRITFSGGTQGAGNFLVEGDQDCSNPTVTSRLDEELVNTGDRPSIVAWAHSQFFISGRRRAIQARVITVGARQPLCEISRVYEDFVGIRDRVRPSIVSDGTGFLLTYSEESDQNPGTIDYDLYMVSGSIARSSTGVRVALSERHSLLSNTSGSDIDCRLAGRRDGDHLIDSNEALCVFTRKPGINVLYGTTRGVTVNSPRLPSDPDQAVGIQYCDAVPNSVGQAGNLRDASWLWVSGTGGRFDQHVVHCTQMPQNQFSMLIAATATGNSLFPGGSSGRLCLGGLFGRYNNAVASSTSGGNFNVTIDPQAIEQPNGPVASGAGATWYFQVWHRDLDPMGIPTSNFSNACCVRFD